MGKYICASCNHRFSSENPSKCPSCGIDECIDDEPSAEDILGDVEEVLGV